MLPSAPRPTSQPEAPSADDTMGRPDFVNVYQSDDRPIPATAVFVITPEHELRAASSESITVFLPAPSPESMYFAKRFTQAYITPAGAACKADPAPFIRDAVLAALPGLQFEVVPSGYGGDMTVLFRSPDEREAALEKQPFELGGASVELVRTEECGNRYRDPLNYLALVALLDYPKEQRNQEDIRTNCSRFGFLLEVDPACFAAPDLSPVRVVLNLKHPREVRIRYGDFRFRNVVPVQILRVWDRSLSVPMFEPTAAAAPAP